MDQNEIISQLTDIFRKVLRRDDIVLTMNTSSDNLPEWDSMNHVGLLIAIQAHFGTRFQLAMSEDLQSVKGVVEAIQSSAGPG